MSSNGVGSSSNTIDPATGRCRFHPGIKLLLSRNDDGEWRTILKACPLCVSGLPPTAAASAVAAEAAAARSHNNDGTGGGDGHANGPTQYNNDPDEKILLKKQKKKKKQQQRHERSPRSRPRSPSPQSPYKRSMHEGNEEDERGDSNDAIDDSTPINRKLFEEGFATTSHSSAPSLQPRSLTSEYSDEQDSVDRMNQNTFRQFINRDREEQLRKEGGGSNDSGTMRVLDQNGMRNNFPPLNGDYNHSNYNSRDGGQPRHIMDVESNGSAGSYHSTSTLSVRTDHRSDVSSPGSYYSSSQSDRRQSGSTGGGSNYSSPRSRHKSGDEVSDNEGSYYSSEEGTYEGNNTESDTGSYASYHEEQSMGVMHQMEGTVDSYPTSRDVHLQQYSHNGQEHNERPSSRTHPQAVGSDVQHQQWSPQRQHYQSYHHTTPSPKKYGARPDPDSHNYHPKEPTQITAAERMMRHQQSTMSPSRSKNDIASYQQAQMQTQIDSRESDDDDEDDDNEREILEPEDVSIISMNSSASRNLKRAKEQKRREEQERSSQVDPDGDDEEDRPIKTCEYDDRGRCVRHPQYQLRKKKMFKGWVTLLSNCPECCLDEMKRVKKKYHERVSSPVGVGSVHSNGGSSSGKKKKKKKSRKKSSSHLPPITQLNVSNRGAVADDNSSSGTASTFTVGSSNTSGRWQNYLTSNTSVASAPTTTARVTRLPYNDQTNGNGWYTGQVSMSGIPHGWGIMNYANGHTFEGDWRNGVSVSKSKEAPPALGSGANNFGSPPHHNHSSHHPHSFTSDHQRRGSYSDPPVPRRRISQLEPLREDPPSTSRSRNEPYSRSRIVNNMPFRDDRGFVVGAYTGEVDDYHVPNGIGKMRYNDGFVSEGRWIDGELDDGYNATDDEEEDDDDNKSYKSSSAMSAPGVTAYYRHDSYRQDRKFLPTSYSGQNLSSKLSGLEQKLSAMEFNNQH